MFYTYPGSTISTIDGDMTPIKPFLLTTLQLRLQSLIITLTLVVTCCPKSTTAFLDVFIATLPANSASVNDAGDVCGDDNMSLHWEVGRCE
jgi:hypothetical protein